MKFMPRQSISTLSWVGWLCITGGIAGTLIFHQSLLCLVPIAGAIMVIFDSLIMTLT